MHKYIITFLGCYQYTFCSEDLLKEGVEQTEQPQDGLLDSVEVWVQKYHS